MLDLRIIAGGKPLPLFDLPALLGREQAAKEIGDQIDALIAFMDDLGGDPDLEAGTDDDLGAEEGGEGGSWPELAEAKQPNEMQIYQDDEREDDVPAARRAHCRRIQQTRCTTVRLGSSERTWSLYRLRGDKPYLRGLETL